MNFEPVLVGGREIPAEAIAAFREAVRLVPAQDMGWYGMGLAHARLGQHEQAVTALE